MKKKAVFIDFSGSVSGQLLRVFAGIAAGFVRPGDEAYMLDSSGLIAVSADRLRGIRDDLVPCRDEIAPGGGGTPDEIPSSWNDWDKYFLTDGEVQNSLSLCFDYIIVVKTPRADAVLDVMFA